MSTQTENTATIDPKTEPPETRRKRQPPYHVILLDDNDHTYEYVIRMLGAVLGYKEAKAFQIAREVDAAGRAILLTTTREHAELKQEQIHSFGGDPLIPRCKGSMTALIQAAPGG